MPLASLLLNAQEIRNAKKTSQSPQAIVPAALSDIGAVGTILSGRLAEREKPNARKREAERVAGSQAERQAGSRTGSGAEDVQACREKLSRGRDGEDAAAVRGATNPQRGTFRPSGRVYPYAIESEVGEANKKRSA